LVLDGTTGQNGLVQARQFSEIAGVTAMAVTKLDDTAKGGVVVAVAHDLQIPVKFIGVGEQMDDLMPFVPKDFAEALV
jgi:fused signal recognition particle receptor